VASAQSPDDSLNLKDKSAVILGVGLTGARGAGIAPKSVSAQTSEVGSLGFIHWVHPELAVTVNASVLQAETTVGVSGVHSSAITPLLFGVSYAPRALAITASLRPYVSAAAGPYVHVSQNAGPTSIGSTIETAPGARLAGGVQWFAARHFMMSVE